MGNILGLERERKNLKVVVSVQRLDEVNAGWTAVLWQQGMKLITVCFQLLDSIFIVEQLNEASTSTRAELCF